jgi:hypothetical protein
MAWSLFSRDIEEAIVPTCRELGISIVVGALQVFHFPAFSIRRPSLMYTSHRLLQVLFSISTFKLRRKSLQLGVRAAQPRPPHRRLQGDPQGGAVQDGSIKPRVESAPVFSA